MTLSERIQARADCTTCGGASLSSTGHKVWCSGHIIKAGYPYDDRKPRWLDRAGKDLTGRVVS